MNSLQLLPTPIAILALALASSLFLMVDGNSSGPLSSESAPLADVNPQLGTSHENIANELNASWIMLSGARQAMTNNDYVHAGRLAEEAQVDAQVAERNAQSTRSRKAAQQSLHAAQRLRMEINQQSQLVAGN